VQISLPTICSAQTEQESIPNFSFTVFDDIEKLNQLQWNKHIPETNVLMQHESLKLIQHIQKGSMQFRYLLVKKEDVTVGVLYFQVVMFHANQLINYFPEVKDGNFVMKGAKAVSEKLLNLINIKLLVSGNVFMTGEAGFYFHSEIDKATRAKIIRKAVNDLRKSDKSVKAVLISDLYEPKTDFDNDFKKCAYHEITVESDMSIKLKKEWGNFDDYLNSLSSKYRVRAKKVLSLCDEAGVVMKNLNADEIALHENRLYELYEKVMGNADFKLAELNKDFFRLQKQQQPDNYRVHAYFKGEVLIGFISAFRFGKRMEVHYTGMDHDLSKPIHLYQLMMYDMIKTGIEYRVDQLHFGRTAPEIKSTIGAVPSPMYGYVKHFGPIFNSLFVRNYTANLKPKQYVFRNPFKG